MSLRDCISDAVAAGEMDPARAREALDLFDELEAQYQGSLGRAEAARRAGAETAEAVKQRNLEKRRQQMLANQVARRIEKDFSEYRNSKGEIDYAGALMSLLDRDELAKFSNVEARRNALRGRFHSQVTELLARFRPNIAGQVRNKAELKNLVRELFGEATGDPNASEFAKAWAAVAETARTKFNAAGGRIPKREDWGLPQHWDEMRVRKVGFDEFRSVILPGLDRHKIIDELTGRPMSDQRLELALRQVYDTIRTDGYSKLVPGRIQHGRALANRHTDHRFLVFRDADSWLKAQESFGAADPFSTMMAHLDRMARDIAVMEILGPNPTATLTWLSQKVRKQAAEMDAGGNGGGNMDRANSAIRRTENMYAHVTGSANAPVNGRLASGFAGLRSLLQSAQLGAAALSAVTDINFQRMAAAHAGLPSGRVVARVAKLFRPGSMADRKLAVRSGLIAENWTGQALAMQRYVGEVSGPEISRRIADAVMNLSLLSPWTQSGRWAFGQEFLGFLADQAGNSFDQLPKALQDTMRRYGIGAENWDVIRKTDLDTESGSSFLMPEDVARRADIAPDRADELATRMLEMVQSETEFAVPSASLRGKVLFVEDSRPGTFVGELTRSGFMYKNFAVTLIFTHLRRAALQQGAMSKGRYLAELAISTTVMGGLAMQMKEVSKGRDPRPMDTAEFWSAAMMQGGGMGVFGDFLFSDVNRFDRGLGETLAGPVVGFANDVRRLTLGNLAQLPGEDKTNFGREVVSFLRRYTPGGSLWYGRLGFERLVLDRLQLQVDPEARRAMRRMERKYARDYGQGYWWRPGVTSPGRGPDLGNIGG